MTDDQILNRAQTYFCWRCILIMPSLLYLLSCAYYPTLGFAEKTDIRHLAVAPKLLPFQVFEWGLKQKEKREFKVFGRLISQKEAAPNNQAAALQDLSKPKQRKISKAVWLYRGQAVQSVHWAKYVEPQTSKEFGQGLSPKDLMGIKTQEEFLNRIGFELDKAPMQFKDLEQLYIICREQITVADDPVAKSSGYTLDEKRVFQAHPPYRLIAYQRILRQEKQSEYGLYYEGQWSSYRLIQDIKNNEKKGEVIAKPIRVEDLETLHSRLWVPASFHVGGGYSVPNLLDDAPNSIIKVIDRRYERVGGMWLEKIEWAVDSFMGAQPAKISLDLQGRINIIELDEGLFAVQTEQKVEKFDQESRTPYKKKHLPLDRRPFSLKSLQQQQGRLPTQVIETMTEQSRMAIVSCLEANGDLINNRLQADKPISQHIVFRLNTNEQGRLIAAGATHHLSLKLTRCLLKSLDNLKFPRRKTKLFQRVNDLKILPFQGTMIVWPVDLTQLRLAKSKLE